MRDRGEAGAVRVLVVDDDRELAELLAETLVRLGHEVVTASRGHEAIAIAAEFMPDVALLDIVLPDINGITLAAVLRGVVETKCLRVVGLSGVEAERLATACERGIFDGQLVKPVSLAAIESLVDPTR